MHEKLKWEAIPYVNDKSVTVIGGVTLTALGSANDNTNGSNWDGSRGGDGSRGLDSDKPPWPAVISVNCRRGHFSLHGSASARATTL